LLFVIVESSMGMAPLRSTLQFTPLLLFFRAFAGWLNQQPQAFYNDVFVFIRLKQGFAPKVVSGKNGGYSVRTAAMV
jgi:hypothetical protein